jgi:tRNA(adenine34) deaminase
MLSVHSDEHYMKEALKQAQLAYEIGEVPVGAVVVCNNKIIARAHNQTEQLNDVTAHAEMIAITAAANYLGAKFLSECSLYVTVEPCVMCGGALYWSQLKRLVFATHDEKRGFSRFNEKIVHPKTEIISGIMAQEAAALMTSFFRKLRNNS